MEAALPSLLRIQNHCAKSEKLVFGGNELRKCVRTFHGRFVYCGNGEGIEVLAKPIFVRGVSPFNGRRTLRPLHPKSLRQIGEAGFWGKRTPEVCTNLSCGRFVFCWERGGDRSIGEANLRKGLAPSMEAAPPSPVPFRVAFGGEIFLNIGKFYFTAKYGRQYRQFYHRFVL